MSTPRGEWGMSEKSANQPNLPLPNGLVPINGQIDRQKGPLKPACLRCKTLKVKCEKPEGESCVRCLKAGVPCEAAPPSRQGKRSRSPDKDKSKVAKVALPVAGDAVGKVTGEKCPNALIRGMLKSIPSRSMLHSLLREWAAISLARNGWSLMDCTLSLAKEHGFSTSELLAGVERLLLPFGPPPPQLAALLEHSEYPCSVRRHVPNAEGELLVFGNKAFVEQVCKLEGQCGHTQTAVGRAASSCHTPHTPLRRLETVDRSFDAASVRAPAADLRACWRANKVDMHSLYVHPEDVQVIPLTIGHLIAQHKPPSDDAKPREMKAETGCRRNVTPDGHQSCTDTSSGVSMASARLRVKMGAAGGGEREYVEVQARVYSMLGEHNEIWGGFELMPPEAPICRIAAPYCCAVNASKCYKSSLYLQLCHPDAAKVEAASSDLNAKRVAEADGEEGNDDDGEGSSGGEGTTEDEEGALVVSLEELESLICGDGQITGFGHPDEELMLTSPDLQLAY